MGYPGAKTQAGVYHRIIGQMPPHDIYVELFLGSGHILWTKRPAAVNVGIDADAGCIAKADAQRRRLTPAAARGFDFHCADALQWMLGVGYDSTALIYADPPYVLSTRKHREYYRHEMTDQEHARFLALVQGLKCRVIISHPPCELYGRALQGWRCCRYKVSWHAKSMVDALWMNFPEPTELHDWRFAGRNYRQRLSLKRLAARWLARLEGMASLKRGYVLDAIAQRQTGRDLPDPATPESALAATSVGTGATGPQRHC